MALSLACSLAGGELEYSASLFVLVLGFSSCFELVVGYWISLLVNLGLLKEFFLQLLGGEGIGRLMFICVLREAGF